MEIARKRSCIHDIWGDEAVCCPSICNFLSVLDRQHVLQGKRLSGYRESPWASGRVMLSADL